MKTIKVSQPYATMICKGLIREVQIELPQTEKLRRCFIYATEQVFNPQTPIECVQAVCNHQLYGNIAKTEALPVNAIVGFIDVGTEDSASESIWSKALDGIAVATAYNARVFDAPIQLPFNAIKVNNCIDFDTLFPSHTAFCRNPYLIESRLVVPVSERLFFDFPNHRTLTLDVDVHLAELLLDENGALRELSELTLLNYIRERTYMCEAQLASVLDENDEPVLYPSVIGEGGKEVRLQLIIRCKSQAR